MSKKNTKTYPTLHYGAEGDLVTMMQDLLSKTGSSVRINGMFGIGTFTALKAFQKKNGLEPNGVCDTETWAKLLLVLKEKKPEKKKELTFEEKVELLWKAHPEIHP